MKTPRLILLFMAMNLILQAQDWQAKEIGLCPTDRSFDIAVADGRNDGSNRLYVTTTAGGLYEWTYTNNQWQMTQTVVEDFIALPSIAIGDGRNDGTNRLYIVEFKNAGAKMREFTWNGLSWDEVIITDQIMSLGIVLGDGRNDGVNRLYATSIDRGLVEFTYKNGQWTSQQVVDGEMEGAPDIGQAKNDGDPSIFAPAKHVWDSDYDNGQFVNTPLDVDKTWPDALQIAPGRNDGINRVYANCTGNGGPGRKEYSWNGTSWDVELVETASQRGDIHVARLQADGKYRVYINTSEYFRGPTGPLDEYEWNGSRWVKTQTVMSTGTHATAMMAHGVGRNDKVVRMYTPRWTTGGIYEITHKEPYVITTVSTSTQDQFDVSISPNPAGNQVITIKLKDINNHGIASLEIYNLNGTSVYFQKMVEDEIQINGKDIGSSGYYVITLTTADGRVHSEQLLKL